MSGVDIATEVVCWLQIVASLLQIGFVIGAIIYFANPRDGRLAISIFITLIGLIVGIIFATRVWKKKGTILYLSRDMATPELDNLDKEKVVVIER